MSRLTTVAAFDLAPQAQLARLVLEEAGIPAVVADEGIVAMEWVLANAVGGIKVQVAEADADRAAAVLAERFGGAGPVGDVDQDELARQALAEAPEDEAPPEEPPPPVEPRAVAAEAPAGGRDEFARRAFFVAWLAAVFPPLALYAGYLWLRAAFGPGPLTRWGRTQVAASALMVFFYLTPVWVVLYIGLAALLRVALA